MGKKLAKFNVKFTKKLVVYVLKYVKALESGGGQHSLSTNCLAESRR